MANSELEKGKEGDVNTGVAPTPARVGASDEPGADTVPPKTEKKVEMVEVPKEVLEKLVSRLEKVESDNELLKEVADKEKLNRMQQLRAGGKLVKVVSISKLDNKFVLGWAKVKDDVYFDEQGRLHEEQSIKVIFEDGGESVMDYRAFSRLREPVRAEVLSETRDNDGNSNLKVVLPDGKEFSLDVKFVN